MAKNANDAGTVSANIINDVRQGVFAPVYLLMGEEPFYVDRTAAAIIEHALADDERDFNQLICYGADVNVSDIVGNARRYPMFAERNLVVVKEAQAVKNLEELSVYTDAPLESTVLVLVYRGKLDKRKELYKSISKNGRVLEGTMLRDYEMPAWIKGYYSSLGLHIDEDAAALLAESAGVDLGRIAVETEKLMKNLPEGVREVTVRDIENNVGISREFSAFELTRQLSYRQADKALRTASYIGADAQFAMPKVTAALFLSFSRVLKYEAYLLKNPHPSQEEKQRVLGLAPFFFREIDAAVRNYPLNRCMKVIALIRDYDFKGKGGGSSETAPGELLMELVTKILNA